MSQRIRAVFHDGVFVPRQPCDLPEGSEVEVIVRQPHVLPPEESDPEERARILRAMVERMNDNPIPENAPRFSREELHERR
ncbi:MAG TPA: antitoxin AF2212-like protein [Blastocatellia bacterium]|nr:antitoxin AF2212-like protein [Blastocatellia bacterium]